MPKAFCPHGKMWTMCDICKAEYMEKNKMTALTSGKFVSDRNLAFKCNWMDTDFDGPCGPEGRDFNIRKAKHVWCSQDYNECWQLEHGMIDQVSEFPCYESGIFKKWEFAAGLFHAGERAGEGKKIHNVMTGKIALLTTRGPEDEEADRYIFGFLRIKDYYTDEQGATRVKGEEKNSLKIPKDSRLFFWDYYQNPKSPLPIWSSGLFRYLNDESITKYLKEQAEKLKEKGHDEELEIVERVLGLFGE